MKMKIERAWIREDEFEMEVTLNYASAEKRHGIDETYIYDKDAKRAYILDDSRSLRSEMDGALVKRRIKKAVFDEALKTAIKIGKEHEDIAIIELEESEQVVELEKMSKEQLIELIKELKEERKCLVNQLDTRRIATEGEIEYMEEESMRNEAYMESHGRIDYGYGTGAYGPL